MVEREAASAPDKVISTKAGTWRALPRRVGFITASKGGREGPRKKGNTLVFPLGTSRCEVLRLDSRLA